MIPGSELCVFWTTSCASVPTLFARCTCHENEMLWHKVERAVQCADAGIDRQVSIDTDPLSFRSQTVTRKKRIKTPKQQFAERCRMDCLHRQDFTFVWRDASAYSRLVVLDSKKKTAPLLWLVPLMHNLTHATNTRNRYRRTKSISIIRHRYDSQVS